jgi:hypothetical protein
LETVAIIQWCWVYYTTVSTYMINEHEVSTYPDIVEVGKIVPKYEKQFDSAKSLVMSSYKLKWNRLCTPYSSSAMEDHSGTNTCSRKSGLFSALMQLSAVVQLMVGMDTLLGSLPSLTSPAQWKSVSSLCPAYSMAQGSN